MRTDAERMRGVVDHAQVVVVRDFLDRVDVARAAVAVDGQDRAGLRRDRLKNFGFVDEVTVVAPGINGKMSEVNAAFGMLQLKHIDDALGRRKALDARYRELLRDIPGIRCVNDAPDYTANHAYFPILVESDYPLGRDELYTAFRENNIWARRYFHPLISDFPMYRGLPSANRANLPVAAEAARKVLCLPMYPALTEHDLRRIVDVIRQP